MNNNKNTTRKCSIERITNSENCGKKGFYRIITIDFKTLEMKPVDENTYLTCEMAKAYINKINTSEDPKFEIVSYDQLKCHLLKIKKDKMRNRNWENLRMKS